MGEGQGHGSAVQPLTELPPIVKVGELADALRVDRKSIYEAIKRGEIPGVRRVGRTIRICRDTVLDWLSQGQGRVPRSRR